MFRMIRKKKNEIDKNEAEALLQSNRRGTLAVNGDNGYPYAIPVNYFYDREAQKIYFHGARAGHKVDALKVCDKVCFTVYGNESIKEESWEPFMQSTVAFGRCHLVEDNMKAMALLKKIAMKYYPNDQLADEEIARSGKAAQLFEIEIKTICLHNRIIHLEIFRKNPSSSGWMKWNNIRIWPSAAVLSWPENMYSI